MLIYTSNKSIIARILQRKKQGAHYARQIDLGVLLEEILTRANDFVPSESGSILLDDPVLKSKGKKGEGQLYFLACYGEGSEALINTSLPDNLGIVGETYQSGNAYLSKDVKRDNKFYPQLDKKTMHQTRSILAVPIVIDSSVIGVIELINRKDKENYDEKDLAFLNIFSGYTSTLIQNALDAMRFEDLSKRDNLTGLYNDRYFYEMLTRVVKNAVDENNDTSLIFFDLDRFKEVNDTHGHLAGSGVLKEIARLMDDVFEETEAILARYGGDEYVILIPDMEPDEAKTYAEIFRKKVAENVFLKEPVGGGREALNIEGIISCSVGVASLFSNVERAENLWELEGNLIRAADSAMYKAKKQGKNRVVAANGFDWKDD